MIVNARASGVGDASATGERIVTRLRRMGRQARAAVTETDGGLREALDAAFESGRRVVLVGGDGSLHAAANADVAELPELALLPAGRANNVARGLAIPVDEDRALLLAAFAPALPVDVLRVETPERALYAVEAVSAGFQADARSHYHATNSGDVRQGARVLVEALRSYSPYSGRTVVDRRELIEPEMAQLFVSNLPYFGFGFLVDPVADAHDGRLEVVSIPAADRRHLIAGLARMHGGHHLEHRPVQWVTGERADLLEPLPLVADTVYLGRTTATVTVERDRLRVAIPRPAATA